MYTKRILMKQVICCVDNLNVYSDRNILYQCEMVFRRFGMCLRKYCSSVDYFYCDRHYKLCHRALHLL